MQPKAILPQAEAPVFLGTTNWGDLSVSLETFLSMGKPGQAATSLRRLVSGNELHKRISAILGATEEDPEFSSVVAAMGALPAAFELRDGAYTLVDANGDQYGDGFILSIAEARQIFISPVSAIRLPLFGEAKLKADYQAIATLLMNAIDVAQRRELGSISGYRA